MASFNFDNATVGYNQGEMYSTLNKIENNCVNATITALTNASRNLRDDIGAVWAGKSAETFKNNVEFDTQEICKLLKESYNQLRARFEETLKDMVEVDENLVGERKV